MSIWSLNASYVFICAHHLLRIILNLFGIAKATELSGTVLGSSLVWNLKEETFQLLYQSV